MPGRNTSLYYTFALIVLEHGNVSTMVVPCCLLLVLLLKERQVTTKVGEGGITPGGRRYEK